MFSCYPIMLSRKSYWERIIAVALVAPSQCLRTVKTARRHQYCGAFTRCVPGIVLSASKALSHFTFRPLVPVTKLLSLSSNPPSCPLLCEAAVETLQASVLLCQFHVRFHQQGPLGGDWKKEGERTGWFLWVYLRFKQQHPANGSLPWRQQLVLVSVIFVPLKDQLYYVLTKKLHHQANGLSWRKPTFCFLPLFSESKRGGCFLQLFIPLCYLSISNGFALLLLQCLLTNSLH